MKSKKFENSIITTKTTVIRNGKVVSADDPFVAETMENMQKQLGNIFNNSFFTNAMENEDNTLETTSTVTQCKSCGANNTMSFGMSAECEYCGSSLS